MSEIKWIKITTDIFDDEKIKLIDTLPDRDALLVIWLKLLSLAGKINAGGLIFLTAKIAYTDEMLATIFSRPLNTIRLAIKTFVDFGMIEVNENQVISVVNWGKHQNIEGMERVRKQNRLRQATLRDRRKQAIQKKSNVISRDSNALDKNRLDKNRLDKNNIKGLSELWPVKCPFRGTVLKRSVYSKKKLLKLIKDRGYDNIKQTIEAHVKNTMASKTYFQQFSTFVNNFPSLEDYAGDVPLPRGIDYSQYDFGGKE